MTSPPSNVVSTIHPDDEMLGPGREEWYFRMGEQAVSCVERALGCAALSFDIKTDAILDLPSGYGRVTRFLKVAFPDSVITASDIVKQAVDFCVEAFGVQGIYSANDPRDIVANTYDLIWCGSLLTHMPEDAWDSWISFFEDHLEPNGSVVFTVHGDAFADGFFPWHMPAAFPDLQKNYWNKGFAFWKNDWSVEGDPGISLSSPEWVLDRLRAHTRMRVTAYMERGWHDAHDVWCTTKVPEGRAEADLERAATIPRRPPAT